MVRLFGKANQNAENVSQVLFSSIIPSRPVHRYGTIITGNFKLLDLSFLAILHRAWRSREEESTLPGGIISFIIRIISVK